MRRLLGAAVLLGVLALAALAVHEAKPTWYVRLVYPLEYAEIVRGHAANYRLEPELIAAVIYQESRFDAEARSPAGAIGLMQLLPETAEGIALRTGGSGWRDDDLLVPELNVRYGSWYLRHLLDKYGDEAFALAAYNAGQTHVDRWRAAGQEIQFPETRHYVRRIAELKELYRRAYAEELGLA